MRKQPAGESSKSLIRALRARRRLLILDNFEHLLAAAPQVADLLSACPELDMLITSREPLRLRWEHVLPVQPLRLPFPDELSDCDTIAAAPAVALFLDRATTFEPEFSITAENCREIAEICTRLDGLPLAIELAASRVSVLTPSALVSRLDRRLDLLDGGERDRPKRQQALRVTFDWSYALLKPAEQSMFRMLGVFATGCTLEAANAIGGSTEAHALELIAALCNKSFLQREQSTNGDPRFRMLETIREYALEQLTAAGEVDEAAGRVCHYYLDFAVRAVSAIGTGEEPAWIQRVEREHDNLRVSLRWLAGHGEVEAALDLAANLAPFWSKWGQLDEGRMWLLSLLALGEQDRPTSGRLAALKASAGLARQQGEDGAASKMERAAQEVERALTGSAGSGRSAEPSGLTTREVEVLTLIARGLTNKEIAQELVLSIPTVQTHLANIFRKIDVHSRAAATAYVLTHRPAVYAD
jgi:predicted ATPase/DNA-binding CsgD family transcriptional regulator